MKKLIYSTLIAAIGFAPVLVNAGNVETIDYAPTTVFTIKGFDSNDNSQLVLDGLFPNTCYKVSETSVIVDKANKRIDVKDKAYHYKGGVCLYMLVPYFKTVNLGMLPEGAYDVFVHDRTAPVTKAGTLNINKATSENPDDFLYAPVEEVVVDQNGPTPVLTIRGTFSQSCLKVKDMFVRYDSNNIVVQPIAERDGTTCHNNPTKYEESVALTNAPTGRVLLHIRSLNGQAVNRVLTF